MSKSDGAVRLTKLIKLKRTTKLYVCGTVAVIITIARYVTRHATCGGQNQIILLLQFNGILFVFIYILQGY